MVKEETWKGSKAKKLLFDDIVAGDVYDTQCIKEIYMSRPEYANFEYKNFVTNLRNLRAAIRRDKGAAELSMKAYKHDMSLEPSLLKRKAPFWPDSAAFQCLKRDIDDGVQARMSTKELWEFRSEYKEFAFHCFSEHVRQTLRNRRLRSYGLFQKSLKSQK